MPTAHRLVGRPRAFHWLVLGVLLVALHAVWSVTIPLMGAPDEPSHVVRAAAVARGQWSGDLGPAPTDGSRPGAGTIVQLPSDYAEALTLPNCFAFHSEQPASCQQVLHPPTGATVPVETFAGQYPPLYYALVGWPSLFLHAEASTYAMRLVSGFVSSVFLLWGVAGMRRAAAPAAATWATLAALTPMTLFLGATVNPQALEISSAFAFWSACLALVRSPGRPVRATVVQAGVAGAVLLNSRSSGPVWAVVAVVVALVLAPPGRLKVLWRAAAVRWLLGVGLVSGVLAAAWVALHGGVVTEHGLYPQFASPVVATREVLGLSNQYLLQLVGNFGWLDAPSPPVSTEVYLVVAGALLLLGLAAASRQRGRLALALAALAVVGVPFVLQVPTAGDTGIIWQGRYVLPVAVGVPLVAAAAVAELPAAVQDLVARLTRWVVPAVAVAQVGAYWWAARRYAEGLSGQLITRSPHWSSPLGYMPGLALYTVLVLLVGALAWRSTRSRLAQEELTPSAERAPAAVG